MTRKHYVRMAAELKNCIESDTSLLYSVAFNELVHGICYIFKEDNPRFDKNKFLEACGLPVDKRW